MPDSILVAYATRYGSTQEVAEAVATALRERGLPVDLRPMRQVESLSAYSAVVLGAPLYIGRLQKDAQRFLAQHAQGLAGRPVAFFALGPLSSPAAEEGWQAARQMLDGELARFPSLTLVARALFGGKYDPARLRLGDRLLAALPASPLHGVPASDVRDWAAIRAWAGELASRLRPGTTA